MNTNDQKINFAFGELKNQSQLLLLQNANLKLRLDKEKKKSMKLRMQLSARRPFIKTNTGVIMFPGKKEMELKLDIMTQETLKLKSVLNGFQKDRCQIEKTQEMFKSICDLNPNHDNGDNMHLKQKLLKELNDKYTILKNEFNQVVLVVSKYRVQLEKLKKQHRFSELKLEQVQLEFNDVSSHLTTIKTNINTDEDHEALKNELETAKNHLDDLNSIVVNQMDEIKAKNKSYKNVLRVKEYQMFRANHLCNEKARLTAEFETGFNQIKEYFKRRLDNISNLPNALLAAQEKLAIQKQRKTPIAETIVTLQKKLKTIMDDKIGGDSADENVLTTLKAYHATLVSELENKEKILADIHHAYDKTQRVTNMEKSRLNNIKIETALKINKTRAFLSGLTEEYLYTIDKLQNEVSKIEASSCFNNEKLNAVTSVMQKQINSLANIFQNAKEQITEMKNIQKSYNTPIDVCEPKPFA